MDQLKNNLEEFLHTIKFIDRLLKEKKSGNTVFILKQKKHADSLQKSLTNQLSSLKSEPNKTTQSKLLLNRLSQHFEEAEKFYKNINIHQRLNEIENCDAAEETKQNSNTNEQQVISLPIVNEGFDLDRLRKRQQEVQHIENAVKDVNEIFCTLASLVNDQSETVTNIENNIDQVVADVSQGSVEIRKARDYYFATMRKMLPLAGAAVGAGVSGPVGLAYGFKLGGAATIALSSVGGFIGGRILSKKIEAKESRKSRTAQN